jgi:hypothetical protein
MTICGLYVVIENRRKRLYLVFPTLKFGNWKNVLQPIIWIFCFKIEPHIQMNFRPTHDCITETPTLCIFIFSNWTRLGEQIFRFLATAKYWLWTPLIDCTKLSLYWKRNRFSKILCMLTTTHHNNNNNNNIFLESCEIHIG